MTTDIGPERGPGPAPAAARLDGRALAADLAAVVLFVALGRTSHREGGAVAGFAGTAWPFLAGAVVGWVALLAAGLAGRSLRAGAVVLVGTVAVGMTLRRTVTDGGTPVSFQLVATTFLALFLLGWRLAAARRAARRRG